MISPKAHSRLGTLLLIAVASMAVIYHVLPDEPDKDIVEALRYGKSAADFSCIKSEDVNRVMTRKSRLGVFQSTPLSIAISADNSAAVQWLLENGADPNLATGDEEGAPLPLCIAAHGQNLPACELLIEYGAELDQCPEPLIMKATRLANDELVRLFLDAGCDPETRDIDGMTSLMMVGHGNAFWLLLDAGADPCAESHLGMTPLFASISYPDRVRTLCRDHLCSAATLNRTDEVTSTLHAAVRVSVFRIGNRNVHRDDADFTDNACGVIENLLFAGADPSIENEDGLTAAELAMQLAHAERVLDLLERPVGD